MIYIFSDKVELVELLLYYLDIIIKEEYNQTMDTYTLYKYKY